MEEDDIESLARKLLVEINRLQKELENLQAICKHEEFKIELKDNFLIKICMKCGKKLGYPNQQEREKSGYI